MVNLEHRLTVDDLIVEYMIAKLKFGYEPMYTTDEFLEFLCFFERKKNVDDVLYDMDVLFKRFFERKTCDWSTEAHLIKNGDVIIPTNRLSNFDSSVINTYFMSRQEQEQIKHVILDFLSDKPKRKINTFGCIHPEKIEVGQKVTALLVNEIWNGYLEYNVNRQMWPKQCRSIEKYLLDLDLAKIISVPSLRDDLLEFYKVVSLRIAYLSKNYENLQMQKSPNPFLPHSNYVCAVSGFDDLLKHCKDNNFEINLAKSTFRESHESSSVCFWDEDPEYVSRVHDINNPSVMKLVRNLNSCKGLK